MKKYIFAILFIIALGLLVTGLLNNRVKPNTFTLGFVPSERAEELKPQAKELAAFLEKQMGVPVKIVIPTSYEPLIEGLKFGHIDAAYLDAGPAWLAYKKAAAKVILAEAREEGNAFYYGELFVRQDSDIQSLEDVRGKKIAFTSWTGSSGFILPIGTMIEEGIITPESTDFAALESAIAETFESYVVAGGYKQALTLLAESRVDIAGGAHDAPERFLDKKNQGKIKTLMRLGKVPSHPIVVGVHVSPEQKKRLVQAFVAIIEQGRQDLLFDLYGITRITITNTEEHLSEFGPIFEAVTGVHEKY